MARSDCSPPLSSKRGAAPGGPDLYPHPLPAYPGLLWVGRGEGEGEEFSAQAQHFLERLRGAGQAFEYTLTPAAGHNGQGWGQQMRHPLLRFFHRGGIGRPLRVALHGPDCAGVGECLDLNPLLVFDSGYARTLPAAQLDLQDPDILAPAGPNRVRALRPGDTGIRLCAEGLSDYRPVRVLANAASAVRLELCVRTPQDGPEVDQIHLGQLALDRVGQRYYRGVHHLPRGTLINDAFACGMRRFAIRPEGNIDWRLIQADADAQLEFEVHAWTTPQ